VPLEPSASLLKDVPWPCVVKPLVLSGSRGVIRADDPAGLTAAIARIGRILRQPDVLTLRDPAASFLQIEAFVPGFEVAVEGVLDRGELRVLAVFDKPDPLDGPYFEETIYLTPTVRAAAVQLAIVAAVTQAAAAAGLRHGPIHAECRVNGHDVVVLEVAARPIGGLCARALRFLGAEAVPASLEALLLTAAVGDSLIGWRREAAASGVLMVPIPSSGILREVGGAEAARRLRYVDDVVVTAKVGQRLDALPEGATYLGFVFASGPDSGLVEKALRDAQACLDVRVDLAIPVNPR
jgi:biotin carboxylase